MRLKQKQSLLPCPFCGNEKPVTFYRDKMFLVQCTNCGASSDNDEVRVVTEKLWNTRTPITQQSLSGSDSKESTPKSQFQKDIKAFEEFATLQEDAETLIDDVRNCDF